MRIQQTSMPMIQKSMQKWNHQRLLHRLALLTQQILSQISLFCQRYGKGDDRKAENWGWLVYPEIDQNIFKKKRMTEKYMIQEEDVEVNPENISMACKEVAVTSVQQYFSDDGKLLNGQQIWEWRMNGLVMFVLKNLKCALLLATGACFGFITTVQALALNQEQNTGTAFSVVYSRSLELKQMMVKIYGICINNV